MTRYTKIYEFFRKGNVSVADLALDYVNHFMQQGFAQIKISATFTVLSLNDMHLTLSTSTGNSLLITAANLPKNHNLKIPNLRPQDFYAHDQAYKLDHSDADHIQIKTNNPNFSPYNKLADHRIYESDTLELLVNVNSNFQNIKIAKTNMYGNILLLDDDINLAESDFNYTRAICGQNVVKNGPSLNCPEHPDLDFTDKTVLVLGGGDGGILNFLHGFLPKNKQPKLTTMIEIDRQVLESCRQHMRKCCGSILDAEDFSGENYKVEVNDCFKILADWISSGIQVDVIINDLTATPCLENSESNSNLKESKMIETTEQDLEHQEAWSFLKQVFNQSLKCLKPDGVYLTQGNSTNNVKSMEMYESYILGKNEVAPVDFYKWEVPVCSYLEMWMFYKIWFKKELK